MWLCVCKGECACSCLLVRVRVCVCESVCVCIHVFMCDREYIREYKTESVPSVCEREGVSVYACKCVCL